MAENLPFPSSSSDFSDWTVSFLRSSHPGVILDTCFSCCSIHFFNGALFWKIGSCKISMRSFWGRTCISLRHGQVVQCHPCLRRYSDALTLSSSMSVSFMLLVCVRDHPRKCLSAAERATDPAVAATTVHVMGSGMVIESVAATKTPTQACATRWAALLLIG